MARTKGLFKMCISSIDYIDTGEAVPVTMLDDVMNLKEGMKITVTIPREVPQKTGKSEGRVVQRRIEKIYKHHVLCVAPNGYKECYTKGEVFIRNFRKKGNRYERIS